MNEELLYAYLDGELTRKEAARLEARLNTDPALAAELAALREVHTALGTIPGHDAGEGFTERVVGAARPRRALLLRLGLPLAAAAALALAVFLPGNDALPAPGEESTFTTEEHIDYVWEADGETYGSLSLNELESQILLELDSA